MRSITGWTGTVSMKLSPARDKLISTPMIAAARNGTRTSVRGVYRLRSKGARNLGICSRHYSISSFHGVVPLGYVIYSHCIATPAYPCARCIAHFSCTQVLFRLIRTHSMHVSAVCTGHVWEKMRLHAFAHAMCYKPGYYPGYGGYTSGKYTNQNIKIDR